MWNFWTLAVVICVITEGGESATLIDCDCEANRSITTTFDDVVLDRLGNQLKIINTKNEVMLYRLEMLRDQSEEHGKLLKNLNEKAWIIDQKSDMPSRPAEVADCSFDGHESKGIFNHPREVKYARHCTEATATKHKSGLHTIQIDFYRNKPFLVYCNDETQGGGWTVVQRRNDGSIDFYRDWASYKTGFGNLNGEFFIGLDKLHALTTDEPQELLIVMTDFDNVTKYAKYDAFAIGDEEEMYALKVLGAYSGDAGDSLTPHVGHKFTTKDKKNDENHTNCAVQYTGAWWYTKCHVSNLNGSYLKGSYSQDQFALGVVWKSWRGYNYSLKTVEILIRPKRS